MLVELNKNDIINLIRGTYPKYEDLSKFEKLGLGDYSASYDRWTWPDKSSKCWDKFSKEELFKIYKSLC